MKIRLPIAACLAVLSAPALALAGPYAPAAGQAGSDAVAGTSPLFHEWATGVADLVRGPKDIANPSLGLASFGTGASALGQVEGNGSGVVSLGDGGHITLTFDTPIADGAGADFAVFENSFSDTFLELAFVDVSSDGLNFFRFPSVSLTQTTVQVAGFGQLDPTNLSDLAGKYRAGYGTPFDLAELSGKSPLLDIHAVRYVRITDVIGTIAPSFASRDSLGNVVNDPYSTPFASGGFDLDGVGAINVVPEPAAIASLLIGLATVAVWRRRSACS